jgi:hypothetical protein
VNKSEQINELATALAKAQAELSNAKKKSDNPFFKSKYADLSEVINVSKPVLSSQGLSIVQMLGYSESLVTCETVLLHISGQYISSTLNLPVAKHDSQGIGSACTYARRYAWAAVCGLAQEDDDGNAAVKGINTQKKEVVNERQLLTPKESGAWANAKIAYLRDGNLDKVLARRTISEEHIQQLKQECEQ